MNFLFKILIVNILIIIPRLSSMEFPYHPNEEVKLISGIQIGVRPTTSSSQEAKKFFNQGLNLIYAFNHDEAYWSFQKAAALDPDYAMAYWGMALALGSNINMDITKKSEKIAYQHTQKALELSQNITESEKDYIKALSSRYTDAENPDHRLFNLNYRDAMKKLLEKYPDDPDAAVLYAESAMDVMPWKLWTPEGDPNEGTLDIVDVLENVLKRNPHHLGANHYYIHAIEASKHPEYALMSAERLKKIAPFLGHIMHMPSHIYILVGNYHEASLANQAAIAADLSYIKYYGLDGIYPLHYLSHNYFFLVRALSMEGKYRSALKTAQELEDFYAPHFKSMPELEYYLFAKLSVLLRFHKWKEILELPKPAAGTSVTEALWHFARGMAFAGLFDKQNALKEQSNFFDIQSQVSKDTVFGFNPVKSIFDIANLLLKAKITKLDSNFKEEITFLEEAIKIQDGLNYNEPPDWYFSVRENLGGAFLQNDQPKEAEAIFRKDLNHHPRNGRSLFGLLLSLKKQKREADSYFVEKEFEEAWKYSDEPLDVSEL
ncbi:MAG TPA: hypothetical protein PLC42_00890 [Parachlamydiaceae bacterium]|nr:hypothetical protein [Parachlamydiaceae bacterium]